MTALVQIQLAVQEDADGHDVYFSHDVVESRFGFDDLRKGQRLEYTLEESPYLRADSVKLVTRIPANGYIQGPPA
jgi:cold shock CspA family protein